MGLHNIQMFFSEENELHQKIRKQRIGITNPNKKLNTNLSGFFIIIEIFYYRFKIAERI